MRLNRVFAMIVGVAAAAVLPALAAQPSATGKDKAAAQVQSATAKSSEILTDLLTKVPAEARESIQRALDATRQGQEAALAALAGQGNAAVTAESAAKPSQEGGQPDVTGLVRAREAVAAGFEHSVGALTEALAKVPEEAREPVQQALERIRDRQAAVLAKLDRLIAGERPGSARAIDRPARPERPQRPERPDRPDIPERPEVPDRPEAPQIPDRPETPANAG